MAWLTTGSAFVVPDTEFYFDDIGNSTTNWASFDTWGATQGVSTSSVETSGKPELTADNNLVWTDSLTGEYQNNANAAMTSIAINVANVRNPQLSFSTRFDLEAGKDYGYVEASGDNGATWQNIATFTGTSTTWRTEKIGLRSYANAPQLMLRFRLITNATITRDGWYVDNVRVFAGSPILDDQLFLPSIAR
jgi:hypothetical protein